MAPTTLVQLAARPRPYVCRRRALHLRLPRHATRSISQGFLRKTIEAEWQWKEQAKEIQAGRKQSFLSMLEERGYIHQIAGDRDILDRVITEKRIGGYCGIDPTAPSMHVGHILPMMIIFWMYLHGLGAVTLLGGATAKIGDPTGRTAPRAEQDQATRKSNMASMHIQIKKVWEGVERMGRKYGYVREWAWRRALTNNNTWLNSVSIVEFLKVAGTAFRLGPMLSRDSVKTRHKSKSGMSFAEFSYPVLQAWDWWTMYHRNGVQLQIGGSDQFGNIVAGIDAINHIRHNVRDEETRVKVINDKEPELDYLFAPYGLTVPLLTTASGEKFGKSAGNAVWLDKEMTSSFELYGFWIKTPDSEVERYLKLFTFLPLSTIGKVMEEHMANPPRRLAQHLLAREFVEMVHGSQSAEEAAQQHTQLFGGRVQEQTASTPVISNATNPQNGIMTIALNRRAPQTAWDNAPKVNTILPKSLVYNTNFSRVLWHAGMVGSKSEGNRLVTVQGAYVASRPGQVGGLGDELKFTPIKHHDKGMPEMFLFDGDRLMLRVGKWKIKMIQVISDEEFKARGLTAPGWPLQKKAEGAGKAA